MIHHPVAIHASVTDGRGFQCDDCQGPVKDNRAKRCRACYYRAKQEVVGELKRCSRCAVEKPLSAFDKRTKQYADGSVAVLPLRTCRACKKGLFREKERVATSKRYRRDRLAALRHYAAEDGTIACACCGERLEELLSIDHIDGSGAEHRRTTPAARNLPNYLRTRGYPPGFQLLCFNCNWAKYRFGECLHNRLRKWPGATVKPGCVVGEGVTIGTGSVVWHNTTIGDGAVIGSDVVIGTCCYIGKGAQIGSGSHLQSGVFVPNRAVLEDRVFCGPHAVLTDDRHPRAGNKEYKAEPPTLRAGASIGAGAVILPGVEVGAGALVAAGAVVTRSVEPGLTVIGLPAKARSAA